MFSNTYTVESQWLEHLWEFVLDSHESLRVNHSARSGGQMGNNLGMSFQFSTKLWC